MTEYNAFLGGDLRKWPLQSTLESGASSPFATFGYAVHLPRAFYALPFWFDGADEQWGVFQQRTTIGGQGFRAGDVITAINADRDHIFFGMALLLKKDLPSGIGLTITAGSHSTATGADADSFDTKTITVPPGSKAGTVWKAPDVGSGDYTTAGTYVKVQFTAADGIDVGTLLDLRQVCFHIKYLAVDVSDDRPCACVPSYCPTSYPEPACSPAIPMDASGFVVNGGVSVTPTSGGGTTSGTSSGTSGTSSGTSSGVTSGGSTTSGTTSGTTGG